MRPIAELCSDAVRLREEKLYYMMRVRCANDELKLVDHEIMRWSGE